MGNCEIIISSVAFCLLKVSLKGVGSDCEILAGLYNADMEDLKVLRG